MKASSAPVFGAVLVLLAAGSAPVFAADDGQASLISGLADSVGLSKHEDKNIDYRERGRLVLPPKKDLPPPGKGVSRTDWPSDVEIVREKNRKKMEDAGPSAREVSMHNGYQLIHPGDDVKVTTSGFEGSHLPSCRVPDPKTGECPEAPKAQMDWNPLRWVGLQKKPQVTLENEPERESLTDPPRGYRAPAEGVGSKIDQ